MFEVKDMISGAISSTLFISIDISLIIVSFDSSSNITENVSFVDPY